MAAQTNSPSELRKYLDPAKLDELLLEVEVREKLDSEDKQRGGAFHSSYEFSTNYLSLILDKASSFAAASYKACRDDLKMRKQNSMNARRVLAREVILPIIDERERKARAEYKVKQQLYPEWAVTIPSLLKQVGEDFGKLRRQWSETAIENREDECEQADRGTVGTSMQNTQDVVTNNHLPTLPDAKSEVESACTNAADLNAENTPVPLEQRQQPPSAGLRRARAKTREITDQDRARAERIRKNPSKYRYMNVREVAAMLGISINAVYDHPLLEKYHTGNRRRLYTTASVLAVINSPPQ